MTSSSHRKAHRTGFTLIELLVVVGMIVLLATILVPAVSHAYKVAVRTRMAADLQVVSQALDAYKHDFGDYPRIGGPQPVPGAVLLCWALVAPGPDVDKKGLVGDGADGPGFRTRGTTGQVWGPYLPADRFRIIGLNSVNQFEEPTKGFSDSVDLLGDRYGNPILYYPAAKSANPTAPNGFVSAYTPQPGAPPQSVFNFSDNARYSRTSPFSQFTLQTMLWRLGETSMKGALVQGESAVATGPYLLWAAGPDQVFGTDDDVASNGTDLQLNTSRLPGQ